MLENIKKQLKKIEDGKMYNPEQIVNLRVLFNTQLKPSRFKIYRLIKRGEIPTVNLGTEKSPRYFVQGKELKQYVKKTYKIK